MAVTVPSGMNWGEVGAYANAFLLHPGFVYHNDVEGRAGLGKWDITAHQLYETNEAADFLLRLGGVVFFPIAAIIIAPDSLAPMAIPIVVGATLAGFVVSPTLVNNSGHFIAGAILDIATLFRKLKG